jgi:hypothetical protein
MKIQMWLVAEGSDCGVHAASVSLGPTNCFGEILGGRMRKFQIKKFANFCADRLFLL